MNATPVLGNGAPTRRRLALFFGVRYAIPAVALLALSASPDVSIDRSRFPLILTAHVLCTALLQTLGLRRPRATSIAIWGGILVDIGLISLLVAMSGGPGSPLTFLFTLEAMTAGILLSSSSGVRVIVLSTGAIVVLELVRSHGSPGTPIGAPIGLTAITALWILGGAGTLFSAFNERELKRRNAELAMIHQITLDIENTLALGTVLAHLTRGVVDRLGFDAAAVLLREDGRLRCVSAAGTTGAARRAIDVRGPVRDALETGHPRIVASDEARVDGTLSDLLGARGYVAVPLSGEGLLLATRAGRKGGRPGIVRGHEVEALQRLAHHATLGLANARLHEHVSAMAITDPLTGLANHGEFQRRLAHELGRLSRYASLRAPGHRLSLILMDVDHFKKVNDRLGHQAGDAMLREASGALREAVRSFDFVARYGGDEFAVILPETDAEGARAVAERIREYVAARQIPGSAAATANGDGPGAAGGGSARRPAGKISVSIGIATAPDNGLVAATLVAAADAALYRAKETGRGRVSHAADSRKQLAKVVALRRAPTPPRRGSGGGPAPDVSRRARAQSSLPKRRTPRG